MRGLPIKRNRCNLWNMKITLLLLTLTLLQPRVLFDFRAERAYKAPRITLATQRAVLGKVFRRYLTDSNRCNPNLIGSAGSDHLSAARRAGQIVPSIAEVATGSFTAPGQNQTAYVIFVNECNATHADNFGSKRVAIFSGPQLVADLDVDFRGNILLKTDLDSDGVDELLMSSGDMNQGTLIEIASLVSFQNGRLRVIQDFGTVVEDSCAALSPHSSARASVISIGGAAPGGMPKLKVDNYESRCGRVKRWRKVPS